MGHVVYKPLLGAADTKHQQPNDLDVSLLAPDGKRRLSIVHGLVHRRVVRQQQPNDVKVSLLAPDEKRGDTVVRALVDQVRMMS